nr:hypothetical protein [Tanacetum cinerariifolium]
MECKGKISIKDKRSSVSGEKDSIKKELSDIARLLDGGDVFDSNLLRRSELHRNLYNINQMESKEYLQKSKLKWAIEGTKTRIFFMIGRNLKAYVDDMVIKTNDEKVLIEDIAKTFDNLQRINMKLNPKKCSFGVEKGIFLEPKWKAGCIKEILVPVHRKVITLLRNSKGHYKGKKDEYRWTESAEKAFQEMKKVIVELPLLTTPVKEKTLYVEATLEAVSAILLAERKGKQCPIHYVSRMLNEAERNYAPLEKLASSLLQMSRRLRRYFEAHPIKVIMDQPLKQILNKAQASRKLAKYSMEFGAYNITYEPTNAMKGQLPNKDDAERWTLFTNGSSKSKGSGAGLVFISPSGVEFTSALRLNFTSMNNEAEYEALLAGLRMARKIKMCRPFTGQLRHQGDPHRILHIGARSVVAKSIRQAYHWPTMHTDARNVKHKCDSCQVHALVPRRPKTLMTSIMSPWPFYQWGMDILGPLPQAFEKLKFVIVAIEYFTKWIEAKLLAGITGKDIKKFVWDNIVYLFGLSRIIVMDNRTQFVNDPFKGWCESLNIKQMNTAVAHQQANGLVERANKSLMEGIKARLGRERA